MLDVDLMEKAFAEWYETLDYRKVSRKLGVPIRTLKSWASRYDWAGRARQLSREISEHWRRQVGQLQADLAGKLLGGTLTLVERAQKLMSKALLRMESSDTLDVQEMKQLANALKYLSDVVEHLLLPRENVKTYVDARRLTISPQAPLARAAERVSLPSHEEGQKGV